MNTRNADAGLEDYAYRCGAYEAAVDASLQDIESGNVERAVARLKNLQARCIEADKLRQTASQEQCR